MCGINNYLMKSIPSILTNLKIPATQQRHQVYNKKKILKKILCDFWLLQALRLYVNDKYFLSKHSLHYTNKPTTQQIRD